MAKRKGAAPAKGGPTKKRAKKSFSASPATNQPATHSTPTHLLDLPGELRNRIWRLAVAPGQDGNQKRTIQVYKGRNDLEDPTIEPALIPEYTQNFPLIIERG
jgi:hypothetical protein